MSAGLTQYNAFREPIGDDVPDIFRSHPKNLRQRRSRITRPAARTNPRQEIIRLKRRKVTDCERRRDAAALPPCSTQHLCPKPKYKKKETNSMDKRRHRVSINMLPTTNTHEKDNEQSQTNAQDICIYSQSYNEKARGWKRSRHLSPYIPLHHQPVDSTPTAAHCEKRAHSLFTLYATSAQHSTTMSSSAAAAAAGTARPLGVNATTL